MARKVPKLARKVPKAAAPDVAQGWYCQKCGYRNDADDDRCASCGESDARTFDETLKRLTARVPRSGEVRRTAGSKRQISGWRLILVILGLVGVTLSLLGFQFSAGIYVNVPSDAAPLVCGALVLLALLALLILVRRSQR